MIIGLTGGYGAGKDTVAEYFLSKGFIRISLSDIIRDQCIQDDIALTRDNLIHKGNELRKKFGPWILAKIAKQKMMPRKDYVVVSIRNPAEVKELKRLEDFHLVNVTSPDTMRFERVNSRRRDGEKYSNLEEFLAKERKEMESKDEFGQKMGQVSRMATIVLQNRYKTKKELFSVLDRLYSDLRKGK
ncbi:MAG: AAA family ATPase [Candidatus Woesearchaeota archaeon]